MRAKLPDNKRPPVPRKLKAEEVLPKHVKERLATKPKISEGLWAWDNPKNGFSITTIHFTADEEKASQEFVETVRRGMSDFAFQREYNLSREVPAGRPVFGREFSRVRHVTPLVANPKIPILYRGWDFGGNQSAVVCQIINGQVRVLKEFANMGTSTITVAPVVVDYCNRHFPEYKFVDVIDPSGRDEGKTSSGKACADVLRDFGIKPVIKWKFQDPKRRQDSVVKLLTTQLDGQPRLLLDPTCNVLIRGFEGAYQFKKTDATKVDKNEFSHVMDALQYVCCCVFYPVSSAFSKDDKPNVRPARPRHRFSS